MTPEVTATQVEGDMMTEVESEVGIECHHTGIAGIALCVGVVEVEAFLAYPLGAVVALPCEDMEVVGIDVHIAHLGNVHACLYLC